MSIVRPGVSGSRLKKISSGDEIPGVVAVLCECVLSSRSGGCGVMSLKRLVVYEATYAETATSQKDFNLLSAGTCRCRCHHQLL